MNAMKRLIVENFQAHAHTAIETAPCGKLTVITGSSDSGKTAILRALKWLLLNDPQGTDYIRVGASFARVTAEFESGHTVIRERTKATNRYKIITPGASEPQIFEGFGNGVPFEVSEITGIRPVQIGDLTLNLNFADQLQGPFLGSSISSGARAKVLGKLAGTEEIDHAGKTLGTDLYRRNQDEKRLMGELVRLDEDIVKYDYLPAMAERISELEQLAARVKAAQERWGQLAKLKEIRQQVDIYIADAEMIIHKHRNVELISHITIDAEIANVRKKTIESLRMVLDTKEDLILNAQRIIIYWQNIELALYNVEEAEFKMARNRNIRGMFQKLQVLYVGIRQAQNTIKIWGNLQGAQETAGKADEGLRRSQRISSLTKAYVSAVTSVCDAQRVIKGHQGLEEASVSVARSVATMESHGKVVRLKSLYSQVDTLVNNAGRTLLKLTGLNDAERALAGNVANLEQQGKVISLAQKLSTAETDARRSREAIVLHENRVVELEGAYRDELVTIGKCPMCGSVVNLKTLKEVC